MIGILKEVAVAFGDLSVSVCFQVFERAPFEIIIGDSTMEDLGGIVELGKRKLPLMKGNNPLNIR